MSGDRAGKFHLVTDKSNVDEFGQDLGTIVVRPLSKRGDLTARMAALRQ